MEKILTLLFNPEQIIQYGGLVLILSFVFAETGLLIGLLLPGDSLLFTAGLLSAVGVLKTDIFTLYFSVLVAGILGDFVGYRFGNRTGKHLYKFKETRYFKHSYILRAKEFYEKYGGMAVMIGRFMPIFRTLVPMVAGVVKMNYPKFLFYNILGAFIWVSTFVLSGYFLGHTFPQIQDYLEFIILGIILLSTGPVIYKFFIKKPNNPKKDFEEHPEEYFPL